MNRLTLESLMQTVTARATEWQDTPQAAKKSYTASLLASGREKIVRKFGEEALEVVLAAVLPAPEKSTMQSAQGCAQRNQVISESADLLYHLCVLWQDADISIEDVYAELARRHGVSGLEEKAARRSPPESSARDKE